MSNDKKLKIGVKEGGGKPPGYEWNVWIIDLAHEEVMRLFGQMGYDQLAEQVKELAGQDDPTHSLTVDIRPIEGYFEIRDKGAPFGGANARLFFGVDKSKRGIVPLGSIKKQNNGPTPLGTKVTMRRRWRKYLAGDYGMPAP